MSTKEVVGGCLAAITIMVLSQILASVLANGLVLLSVPTGVCNIVFSALYLAIAFFLVKLLIEKVLKRDMSEFGIPRFAIQGKYLVVAFALPIAVTAAFLLFVKGEFVPSGMSGAQVFSTLSIGVFYFGIAAGFVEEIVFRGVLLNLLKSKLGTVEAVLIPSALFGLIHVLGTSFSLESCILTVLAGTLVGIMFSLIALESGSIWNSGIVHSIWNIVILGGGLSVGSAISEESIVTYVLSSTSPLITGGEFGIESSLIAILGYVAVTIMVLVMMKRN